MSNGNGHRWSKFWWRDHQGDAALRACSLAARGYWMELLCIAHEAEQVGYVLLNSKQPTGRQIAIIAGCSEREARKLEAELEDAGVFSRLPDGTIYSRRMVKDAEVAEAGREHIAKRWNGAKPPDPPNRVPIRVATSQPTSPPGRDPIFPPDPPYPEAEEEPEEEERVSNRSNLHSFSPYSRESQPRVRRLLPARSAANRTRNPSQMRGKSRRKICSGKSFGSSIAATPSRSRSGAAPSSRWSSRSTRCCMAPCWTTRRLKAKSSIRPSGAAR